MYPKQSRAIDLRQKSMWLIKPNCSLFPVTRLSWTGNEWKLTSCYGSLPTAEPNDNLSYCCDRSTDSSYSMKFIYYMTYLAARLGKSVSHRIKK